MRRFVWSLIAVSLLAGQAYSAAAQQPPKPSPEDALKAYRSDLQGERADIMAKNLTLTADQAAKFWPAYSKFQAEQGTIVDAQLAAMSKYVASYGTIDDAKALEYVNANLTRDDQMHELRVKWLKEFEKILPARIAARVIQIDRRLGLAHQLFLSSQLPLVY
jgi:Spy/CpxP family protein refolding chaperone